MKINVNVLYPITTIHNKEKNITKVIHNNSITIINLKKEIDNFLNQLIDKNIKKVTIITNKKSGIQLLIIKNYLKNNNLNYEFKNYKKYKKINPRLINKKFNKKLKKIIFW